ncbi:nitroreductase family deazaflavin-dependent oxidoreductase [Intrasporangium oryzae]|uniref:nitroreductase family deazaflavin-dependent oxidoreductase n=1 Tax=Intrasporangium oryzae TaxID=412687 RepID=UPI0004AEAFE0|nr:nitroreductase family deazaflavin-dependent oxidoreductase [Intrasporangium oryzae]
MSTSQPVADPWSSPLPAWLKRVYAAPGALYDHGLGRLLGHRFVRIGHIGRRTGLLHHAVVEVTHYDRVTGEATVMAGYGPRADWVRNIRAAGGASLDFGHGPRPAAYRVLDVDEAIEVFRHYERRNVLLLPGIRATLWVLLGWRYDGSEPARRRLAEQLPMLAFRPVGYGSHLPDKPGPALGA